MLSTTELARSASLIFSGTVEKLGESLLPEVPARQNLVLVRVDRGLRVDPALGELRGRLITMETAAPSDFRIGQQAVFFTKSWIHGREIAVHEIAHLDMKSETEVASVVRSLPDIHLKDRLLSAQMVVVAEVAEVRDVPGQIPERRAPLWAVAVLHIEQVLKGKKAAKSAKLYFPTSQSHHWIHAPRFTPKQNGVFLLHVHETRAVKWLEAIGEPNAFTALDPADFQSKSRLQEIRSFLREMGGDV